MSGPLRLTPETLESLLAGREKDAFAAFVADLYERTGHETEQRANVITTTAPNGDRERLLVWTDDRTRIERLLGTDPPEVDVEDIDAVVSLGRDAATAATTAAEADADLLETTDLHDRLLYAMDRETCRDLCQAHFDRAVEPRPAPAEESESASLAGLPGGRIALAALVVCSLIVLGAAGLPGAMTPDGAATVPGEAPTADQPGSGPVTPVGGAGGTPTPTPAPPTTEIPTNQMPTVTPAPPTVSGPTITNATAIDLKDGDGVVADGDLVEIRANITDNDSGVERVVAVGGEYSTERVSLNSSGNNVYNGTFRVDAADIGSNNVYRIRIIVEDGTGNYAVAELDPLDTALVNVTGSLGEGGSAGAKTVFARIHDGDGELPPDGSFVSETLTDGSGNFTLEVPTNSTYDIFYYGGDFLNEGRNLIPRDGIPDVFAIERVAVGESGVSVGDQAPPPGHDLDVFVVNESGNPVEGAQVMYVHTENDTNDSALASLPALSTNADGLADVSGFETTARDVAGLEVAGNVTVLVAPPGSNVRSTNRTYTRTITVTEDDRITVTINETRAPGEGLPRSG
ncbi:MAG: hypothetical protein ABEH88_13205 [Halobacteriales archaeon]